MAECPICLEALSALDTLGRVHHCLHQYHHQCILQWSSHSNLCPTCRKLYYAIDVVSNNSVVETVPVKDRLIENDAINHIPPEFIIPPATYTETDNSRSEDLSGVCTICSSARYSRQPRSLLCCIGCGAKFHALCLAQTDDSSWFCPVCDCGQEYSRTQFRRARPPVRRGLLVFNENNEIEDFELETTTRSSVLNGGILLRREARARQNLSPDEARSWEMFEEARSGSLLGDHTAPTPSVEPRKRRRRRVGAASSGSEISSTGEGNSSNDNSGERNLAGDRENRGDNMQRGNDSIEGAGSTTDTMFRGDSVASAYSVTSGNSIATGTSTEDTHTHTARASHYSNTASDTHSTVSSSSFSPSSFSPSSSSAFPSSSSEHSLLREDSGRSRIASLMSQIRRPRHAGPAAPVQQSVQAHSPLSSASLHMADSDSDAESRRFYTYELTLEQKRQVQRHVRNHLRPMYHPTQPELGDIRSEAQYIDVNRSISHRVYAEILAQCGRDPRAVSEYFADEARLKMLVDGHVEGWTLERDGQST